jgi:hypothetical protein
MAGAYPRGLVRSRVKYDVTQLTTLPTPDRHPYRGLQRLLVTQQSMPQSRFAPQRRPLHRSVVWTS